jgi:hypothetical protein
MTMARARVVCIENINVRLIVRADTEESITTPAFRLFAKCKANAFSQSHKQITKKTKRKPEVK